MSTTTRSADAGESDPQRYLRYAGYTWLLYAGLWGLLITVQVGGGIAGASIATGVVVGLPLLVYYGLRRGSRAAWFAHMGLSLLSVTSIISIVGLYFGWKGREAAGVYWRVDESASGDQPPSPSAPTASRSPAPESSTDAGESDDTTRWGTDDGDGDGDEDESIEYWGVDDQPTPTGDWGDGN